MNLRLKKACIVALSAGGIASAVQAQNISTLLNQNNSGSVGGIVYFDVDVGGAPLSITSFDVNTLAAAGTNFGFTVYITSNTFVGKQNNAAAWTMAAVGVGTAAGTNQPSHVRINNPVKLNANTGYGMAIVLDAAGQTAAAHAYSGTGANPAPGALNYGNSELRLSMGEAQNVPFVGAPFTPRVWNGRIYYRSNDVEAPVGNFVSTFSGNATRGYYFTAPGDMVITGFYVPNETGQSVQNVEIVRLAAAPPAFPAVTNNFTSLGRFVGRPASDLITTNIQVNSGDIIGILGAAGTATMQNSYGATAPVTTMLGTAVTLRRMGMQFNLNTTNAQDLWTEASSIARVELYYRPVSGWIERGDAGEMPFSAQVTRGRGALTSIDGTLAANETDMYRINVCNAPAFSASTVGGTTVDTQLFLFRGDGMGVTANDDTPAGAVLQSFIDDQCLSGNGPYYLAVSQYDRNPVSASGLIFPNSPFNVIYCNTGPGGGQPLSGWVNNSGAGGAYTVALTGSCFADQWSESGDAGSLPGASNATGGISWLNQIRGTLNTTDEDLYRINICNPGIFSATTTGGTSVDTQLFLFNNAGLGVVANDDNPNVAVLQSFIDDRCMDPRDTGTYFVAVSQYNRDPSSAGGAIFPNSPFNQIFCNTAAGGILPVNSWQNASGAGGGYSMFLQGVCYSQPTVPGGCYPNCDGSTTAPILNVADFTCFLQRFAANDPYANCDGSTIVPVLNVADFTCFLQEFASGCR